MTRRTDRAEAANRAEIAGAASAEAAIQAVHAEPEVEEPGRDLTAAAFFDVDNTMMMGASLFWFARGPGRPQVLHRPRPAPLRWQQVKFRVAGNENADDMHTIRDNALAFVAGRSVAEISRRRGDLRRVDGRPDLVGHPGARPAAPRRRAAGLAGHRHPGRAGQDHRQPARAHRGARHGRRGRGRRLHRPAGRRAAARAGQGRGRPRAGRAGGSRPDPVHRLQRLGQRPADAVRVGTAVAVNPDTELRASRPRPRLGRSATSAPAARRRRSASRSRSASAERPPSQASSLPPAASPD